MITTKLIVMMVGCHLLGDYVLQSNYIATTKGENWYHLIVHCVLYTIPFVFALGIHPILLLIFVSHIIIDALKARWHIISYVTDQLLHYGVLIGITVAMLI